MNPTIASPLKVGILKGVQILVVDNDADSGVLYSIFLEHFGANVMTANSIKEALEILTWFIPNIMICETRFLGESVYTLFNRLSAMELDNNNHIPVIVTSTCTTSTNNEIPEIELEKYLLKPVDINELILMIINLLVNSNNILSAYGLKSQCNNQIKLKEGLAVESDILLTT